MDWKRTMNRDQLQQYLTQLLPELNLRILLETESSEKLLWVESAAVTVYQPASERKNHAKKQTWTGWLWNRLMGMTGLSRTLKKYKKERR